MASYFAKKMILPVTINVRIIHTGFCGSFWLGRIQFDLLYRLGFNQAIIYIYIYIKRYQYDVITRPKIVYHIISDLAKSSLAHYTVFHMPV